MAKLKKITRTLTAHVPTYRVETDASVPSLILLLGDAFSAPDGEKQMRWIHSGDPEFRFGSCLRTQSSTKVRELAKKLMPAIEKGYAPSEDLIELGKRVLYDLSGSQRVYIASINSFRLPIASSSAFSGFNVESITPVLPMIFHLPFVVSGQLMVLDTKDDLIRITGCEITVI